jgi:hypothetical protein
VQQMGCQPGGQERRQSWSSVKGTIYYSTSYGGISMGCSDAALRTYRLTRVALPLGKGAELAGARQSPRTGIV